VFEVLPKEKADLNLFYETPTTGIILRDGMFIRLADTSITDSPFKSTATISVSTTNSTSYNKFQVDPQHMNRLAAAGTEVEIGIKDANDDVVYSQVFKLQENIVASPNSTTSTVSGQFFSSKGVATSGTYTLPPVVLNWHNCFSFGNGVESNRLFDDYNAVFMDKGPVVSTILEEAYEEDHRKYSMIYSGIYNETSGVNRLNQFIQAEKITKDLNPDYGSIQKLFTRNTNR